MGSTERNSTGLLITTQSTGIRVLYTTETRVCGAVETNDVLRDAAEAAIAAGTATLKDYMVVDHAACDFSSVDSTDADLEAIFRGKNTKLSEYETEYYLDIATNNPSQITSWINGASAAGAVVEEEA